MSKTGTEPDSERSGFHPGRLQEAGAFPASSAVIDRRYHGRAARGRVLGVAGLGHERARIASSRAAQLLDTSLPGWTLLFALVFAPWFWGCTWPLGVQLLNILLMAVSSAWAFGSILRNRPSGLPAAMLIAILALLVQGWLMAINGSANCDENTGLFIAVPAHLRWLPGSVDQASSRSAMFRLTGLVGASVVAAWLGRQRRWRHRFLWTLTATALSIAFFGCWQRWTHATDIFWSDGRHLDFFFATYRNVTNAGEYLNFALPVASSFALISAVKKRPISFAVGVSAAVIIFAGVLASGSKIAPAVAGINAALFIVIHREYFQARFGKVNRWKSLLTLLLVGCILAAIVQSVGLEISRNRWERVFSDRNGAATFSHRLQVDQICALAAPDAGLAGFGPGTFRAVFPYYCSLLPDEDLAGVWTYAHNDYAQTFLEWGLVGTTFWSLYFFGGLAGLARIVWGSSENEERIWASGLFQALLGISLMALVDFPLQIASIQLVVSVAIGLGWSGWIRMTRNVNRPE